MNTGVDQRIVIGMIDGFDIDYLDQTDMPVLKGMMEAGFFKRGEAIFPTLTNANNISIACGSWPDEHGVTTNCYFDELSGEARFLESPDFLTAPTLFKRASDRGVKSTLLTCKSKTTKILGGDTEIAIAAEEPGLDVTRKYGDPPHMYSCEINYWLWHVAIDLLNHRPDIGLVYVHTTDYPMHMWPPEAMESKDHLQKMDALFGAARNAAPDASFLITADHGMNPKKRCWDLSKACAARGLVLKFAVSPVADRLLKHHRGFGGVSYVYLESTGQADAAIALMKGLDGVEEVLTRDEAARRFRLMPDRIGDLIVIPDQDTVFGDLASEQELLDPTGYRSHGSLYERDIPLIAYNALGLIPPEGEIQYNIDLTRLLFR